MHDHIYKALGLRPRRNPLRYLLGVFLALAVARGDLQADSGSDDRLPVFGCWFWQEEEFVGEGYRPMIDLFAERSTYTHLTTSIRAPDLEVTHQAVLSQIAKAAAYARERGLEIVMDLDVRLARQAFMDTYPGEMQQMIRLGEAEIGPDGKVLLRFQSEDLNDHYTFRAKHYVSLEAKLLRVYAYVRQGGAIRAGSVKELTAENYRVIAMTPEEIAVSVKVENPPEGGKICAIVAFTHFTPDVFAPHLLEFQREILNRYQEAGLAGACKDEWGFPPDFTGCPGKNDYWYSDRRAEVYANRTGGRDALRDFLLMTFGEEGRERERKACINHWLEMSRLRNAEIETDFYHGVKETFGPDAIVGTHPTWYPFPGVQEFKKNGLDWWAAKRDLAQTDEITPYCVRTALAKKWNSAVWYNMYYSKSPSDYNRSIWSYALAGGRMNVHPLFPLAQGVSRAQSYQLLLTDDFNSAMRRTALLARIADAPLDSPVAVLFGHACAMNWAGPHYGDTGVELADRLWEKGYPVDLIPTSEITNGSMAVDSDGALRYGPQRYAVAVLYHPEFENAPLAAFLRRIHPDRTSLYRVGEWNLNFEGEDFDGDSALTNVAVPLERENEIAPILERLAAMGVETQTPAAVKMEGFGFSSLVPPPTGRGRLLDGTVILVSGEHSVSGDPIREAFEIGNQKVEVEAEGLFAIRIGIDNEVEAFAAGGLRRFHSGNLSFALDEPVDLACWKDPAGNFVGVLGGSPPRIPEALRDLTEEWSFLSESESTQR